MECNGKLTYTPYIGGYNFYGTDIW